MKYESDGEVKRRLEMSFRGTFVTDMSQRLKEYLDEVSPKVNLIRWF